MTDAPIALSATPHAMPATPGARLALFAFRRLGAHGLDDAAAAQAMLASFGAGFSRPLILMRAMMADLATSAVVPISIAACARRTPNMPCSPSSPAPKPRPTAPVCCSPTCSASAMPTASLPA
jgi:hypothetical protein